MARDSVTHSERVSDRELVITRWFAAKPELVFDCFTQADLLRRWWAPKKLGVELYDMQTEPRLGGTYYFQFGPKGKPPVAFRGVYKEFVRGERLVYTQKFEPNPMAGEGLITMTFTAEDGGTAMRSSELFPSKEVLEFAISSGMEKGMRETLEQLSALLPEL